MRIWTVTTLTNEIKRAFDRFWPRLVVEGEVAQVQTPRSGHCYFQLREGDDTIGAVMWRSDYQRSNNRPKVGSRVRCRGKMGYYQGRAQLYVHTVEPAGEGALARKLKERLERLRKDGLLDPALRRPLPAFPLNVGVATSPNGAAFADFLRISRQRFPAAKIYLSPCIVQGETAPASVIRAVDLLIEHGKAEVIVVTRGGGSKEDLLAFSDEQLARYIAACPVPIVSAIGHEIDTSLSDLVADASAATPSAAASLVFPDARELHRQITDTEQALSHRMGQQLRLRRERVTALRARLRHPTERLQQNHKELSSLTGRLHRAFSVQQAERARRLQATERYLHSLSPLAVLDRGFAVVRSEDAQVLRAADATTVGAELNITLAHGTLKVAVVEIS